MTRDNIFESMGYWEFVRRYMGPNDPHIDMEDLHEQARLHAKNGNELHEFVERYNTVVASEEVFCPFGEDFVCVGGCPSMLERACINGLPDE